MQYLKTFLLLSAIITTFIFNSYSQQDRTKPYHLTHEMSPEEKELMKNYSKSFYETDPPTGEVRNIAEWEPMESVLIAYDGGFGIPMSFIAEMSEDCEVTTIVSGSSEETYVRGLFTSGGVNLDNCNFVYQNPDSWWTRDYSPWYVAIDNSEVAIVNFPYNRPRPNDNDVPILMANDLNLDLYGMDVTHTGGNYMCDGYGIAASTDLVWDEETQTPEQINTKMLNYLGINTYHVTADPLDDYIKHIDCWGKFLDVDKILITQVPASDYRYDDYEAIATYFSQQICSWGYPYEVIRVQAAEYYDYDVNPYTNSLILNDKVFVPQTGSNLDDDAIAVYEAAMPGYEIIGVNDGSGVVWYNSDALHCRTHGVADREMLYIKHYPLYGEQDYEDNFSVEAEIVSFGGSPFSVNFPKLFYRQNSGSWEEVIMANTSGNTYTGSIPVLSGENTVEYYIHAENENNRSEMHPNQGSFDPHIFNYTGSNVLVQTNDEICTGSSTGDIAAMNYTGTITDWEKRLDSDAWQSIGFTGDTYSETPSSPGIWDYRVEFDNGAEYSTIVSVNVYDQPLADFGYNAVYQEVTFTNLSENATDYLWDFGDGNTSYEESPVYNYTANGTFTVTLTASNNICTDDEFSQNIVVDTDNITEINSNITIFPNPNHGSFQISNINRQTKVEIYNISGKHIYSKYSENNNLSVTGLKTGLYLIKIENNGTISYHKLIIK